MKTEDIKKMAQAWKQVQEASYGKPKKEASDTQMGTITVKTDAERKARAQAYRDKKAATNEAMDPVDHKELKGKHKDRKDKDINNDGKVDSTDKYLHNRRKTVSSAIKGKKKDQEVEVQTSEGKLPPALQAYMDKKKGKKKDDDKDEVKEAQVDEISKKTLGSYVKKASSDQANQAYNLGSGKEKDFTRAFKRKAGIAKATDKLTKEAKDHGNTNNGSPAGEGLSPSAKDQLAKKTPAPAAFDVDTVNKKTFDAIRASGKKAAMRNGDNTQGDKNPPKGK